MLRPPQLPWRRLSHPFIPARPRFDPGDDVRIKLSCAMSDFVTRQSFSQLGEG